MNKNEKNRLFFWFSPKKDKQFKFAKLSPITDKGNTLIVSNIGNLTLFLYPMK